MPAAGLIAGIVASAADEAAELVLPEGPYVLRAVTESPLEGGSVGSGEVSPTGAAGGA